MSTQPLPASGPAGPSILQRLLMILDIGLKVTAGIVGGPLGAGLTVAQGLEQIALHANAAYQQEVGQPINMTKVPPELPVP